MNFTKTRKIATEFSGESFVTDLKKKDGTEWLPSESGIYELYDSEGTLVSTGVADKSTDNMTLTFLIPAQDTINLTGYTLLLLYLTNSTNADVKDVMVEYHILYKERKGEAF